MRRKSLKKNDWYRWASWPGIPWFHSCYSTGLALGLQRRSGSIGLSKFAADYREGIQSIYLLKHEWREGGKLYLAKVLEDPKILEHHLLQIERTADALYHLNRHLLCLSPTKLTLLNLGKWYERFHHAQHELWCAGMVPNLLELNNAYLSSYLRIYLEKQQGKRLSQEVWQTLIAPTQLSFAQKEERAFLKLVDNLEKDMMLRQALLRCGEDLGRIKKILQQYTRAWRMLRRHWKTYRWITFAWIGPAQTFEYYLDLLVRMLKPENAKSLLTKTLGDDRALARRQRRLERTLPFDAKHRQLLVLLRRVLFDKVYRVDALYQGYYAMESILRELAKRLSLSMNQIYMIYGGWMPKIIKTRKADVAQLNAALKYSAFIKEGKQLRFYVGQAAEKKMAPILRTLPRVKVVQEAQGECGYPGKVKGRAVRIDTVKDLPKMQEGDILVSHATDPSLLPAMKKAAAFVTDLGGLTAHAAIVAREMKKPCVVGAKIATQIFQDGDRMEVDATRGLVRKIV